MTVELVRKMNGEELDFVVKNDSTLNVSLTVPKSIRNSERQKKNISSKMMNNHEQYSLPPIYEDPVNPVQIENKYENVTAENHRDASEMAHNLGEDVNLDSPTNKQSIHLDEEERKKKANEIWVNNRVLPKGNNNFNLKKRKMARKSVIEKSYEQRLKRNTFQSLM